MRHAMIYGALKDYERATSGFLQRINRSSLVNLGAVWRHETNPKFLLYLVGIDEPFSVSRSNQAQVLRQLA
ncbi:MAG: LytTR family transcriptional regulator DNA-binding domain-containing protein [bacterium]|nr:LytTR family transcriptional regulator DNA-binding domain-containing protein [bacterium]